MADSQLVHIDQVSTLRSRTYYSMYFGFSLVNVLDIAKS